MKKVQKKSLRLSRIFFASSILILVFNFSTASTTQAADPPPVIAPAGTSPATLKEFNDCRVMFNSHKYAEAADGYARVCAAAPTFAEAHLMYGATLVELNKPKEAEVELLKANSIKADMPLFLINLGKLNQLQGKYEEALVPMNKYLKLYPNDAQAASVRGIVTVLKTELLRRKGATNSAGLDNYLSEAVEPGAIRWAAASMPIKVYISSGDGVKEFKPEYTPMLKDAFKEWSDATQGKLSLTYVDNANDAAITCKWVDDPKEVITPAEWGQTMVVPDNFGIIMQARMKVLTQLNNSIEKITIPGMRQVCLHETGHALGIYGHSSQPSDVMFGTVNVNSPNADLTDRDKKTIFQLYDAPDSFLAEHKYKTAQGALVGNDSNATNHALRVNGTALDEFKAGHFTLALKDFQEALRLQPENDFIRVNIAYCYGELGKAAYNAGDMAGAEKNLKLAVEPLVKYGHKESATAIYHNLSIIAHRLGHDADAKVYETKSASFAK